MAAVCFVKAPPLLGQAVFLIYEGVRRRPETRRCQRPIGGGARGHSTRTRGATPFGPPAPSRVHLFVHGASFPEKMAWYFSPILFHAKNSQRRDFAKNSVRISSFYQMINIPLVLYSHSDLFTLV